jgi:hypothetical protein
MLAQDYTQLCQKYLASERLPTLPAGLEKPWWIWTDRQCRNFVVKILFSDWEDLSAVEKITRIRSIERAIARFGQQNTRVQLFLQAIWQQHTITEINWQRRFLVDHNVTLLHKFTNVHSAYRHTSKQDLSFQQLYKNSSTANSYAYVGSCLAVPGTIHQAPKPFRVLPMATLVGRLHNGADDIVVVYLKATQVADEDLADVATLLSAAANNMFNYLACFQSYTHLKENLASVTEFVLNDLRIQLPTHLKETPVDYVFSRSIQAEGRSYVLSSQHGETLYGYYDPSRGELQALHHNELYRQQEERITPLRYDHNTIYCSENELTNRQQTPLVLLPKMIYQQLYTAESPPATEETLEITTLQGQQTVTRFRQALANMLIPTTDLAANFPLVSALLDHLMLRTHVALEQQLRQDEVIGDDIIAVAVKLG